MIQLQILSGARAGETFDSRGRSILIGRTAQAQLVLDEPGVFAKHCTIAPTAEGVHLEIAPDAYAFVNGAAVTSKILRNGDQITLGSVNVRFNFSPMRQSNARVTEWLTWIGLAALCAGQIWAIYWLSE